MGVWQQLRDEWPTIRKIPLSAAVLFSIGCAGGYSAARWYYEKQVSDQNGTISRYQVALGFKKPVGGALVELKNQELRAMTLLTVGTMRSMYSEFETKQNQLDDQCKNGILDKSTCETETTSNADQLGMKFAEQLRADVRLEDAELRKRLPQEAQRGMVLRAADGDDAGFVNLVPDIGVGFYIEQWANDLEQMAKALPKD